MAKGSGIKTNDSPARAVKTGQRGPAGVGVKASAKYIRTSAYKVRVVLDQIRGHDIGEATDILRFCPRDAAITIGKVLQSAVANAAHNDGISVEELYVSACYADEGPTIKRFRPRARGRTGRINKRTSHIIVVVSQKPESLLKLARSASAAQAEERTKRTAASKAANEKATADARREDSGVEEVVAGAVMNTVADTEVTEVTDSAAKAKAPKAKSAKALDLNALEIINGVGPALATQLRELGIETLTQLSELTDEQITDLDSKLPKSTEQITQWRTEAGELIAGQTTETGEQA